VGPQNQNVGGYQSRGFVEVLAATQTIQKADWFQGTADAVRSYLWLFEEAVRDGVEDYLILSGAAATPPFLSPPLFLSLSVCVCVCVCVCACV
jgi:hypothetical protein